MKTTTLRPGTVTALVAAVTALVMVVLGAPLAAAVGVALVGGVLGAYQRPDGRLRLTDDR